MAADSNVIPFPNSMVISDEERARREAFAVPPTPEQVIRNNLEGLIYTVQKTVDERGLGGHPEVRAFFAGVHEVLLSHDPEVLQAGLNKAESWVWAFFVDEPPPASAIAMPRPR